MKRVTALARTGAAILISEFLSKLDEKKYQLRKEFIINRKIAHEKYLLSQKNRSKLKHTIKAVETRLFPTNAERQFLV